MLAVSVVSVKQVYTVVVNFINNFLLCSESVHSNNNLFWKVVGFNSFNLS